MEGEKMMEETRLDGMTSALHVAAIKGQVLVLRELVRIRPDLARVPTELGETALHLTVKWNHLGALKVLVEEMMNNKVELVNSKDCKGNTVLHVGVSNKHLEIVSYLLTLDGLQVNALNKNGLTALDLLPQSPQELKEIEIERALRNTGASSGKDLHLITHDWLLGKVRLTTKTPSSHEHGKKMHNTSIACLFTEVITLVVIFSLIATLAFKAGQFLPSFWPKDFSLKEGVNNPYLGVQFTMYMFYGDPLSYNTSQIMILTYMLGLVSLALVCLTCLHVKQIWWKCIETPVIIFIIISVQVLEYFLTLREIGVTN